ncbi:MFS general substrate transporter [Coemansia reversa NRRL 1564]|uniref:MFS general substrate transporter n=1 Tax=Coemansia reversa (strain ATCC 12441 / NRRL 1564) TaxID=763665 RepID=A0A2G5BH34_COERN|nr:MFS general substrate transporter [Coemansia reversa NRRL 1564]|eukprot:PIA18282.1 MFS general substrate transporter [Coemansia reversa NRRL 1564]
MVTISANGFLNRCPLLCTIRRQPATVWVISAVSFFIDTFIYSLTVAMLPDILQKNMGASESATGLVTTMFGIGGLIGSLSSGILSDHYHNRNVLQIIGSLIYVIAGIIFYYSKHYYQLLLFRFINGIASGIACTLLCTAVGDVYPANLLGFKLAIAYLCNDIAYTIGPICGEKLYQINGVYGPALLVIALGLFKLLLLVVFAEDSLIIREFVRMRLSTFAPASLEQDNSQMLHGKHAETIGYDNAGIDVLEKSDSYLPTQKNNPNITFDIDNLPQRASIPLWRLLMKLPVVISAFAIISCLGIQGMLEGLVPLHLIDRFNRSDFSGMAFVILGLVFTVLVSAVGKLTDATIKWRGEVMRYYIILFGSVSTVLAMLLMTLANTYATMMVGFSFFALTNLCMCIPAQSAFGDFVNGANADSMARGYSIAICAWAVGAIALPAIGSALYSHAGFTKSVMGVSSIACAITAGACLTFIIRKQRSCVEQR